MSSENSFETGNVAYKNQEAVRDEIDDRQGLLGFVGLMSLAIPALLIRILFPDLNPLILAGLGGVAYSAYLALLFVSLSGQTEEGQSSPAPATLPQTSE